MSHKSTYPGRQKRRLLWGWTELRYSSLYPGKRSFPGVLSFRSATVECRRGFSPSGLFIDPPHQGKKISRWRQIGKPHLQTSKGYFRPHLFCPPSIFPKPSQQQNVMKALPLILKFLFYLWLLTFMSLVPSQFLPLLLYYIWLFCNIPDGMFWHLLLLPTTAIFVILHFTLLIFIILLLYYI